MDQKDNAQKRCLRCSGTGTIMETSLDAAYIAIFGFPMPTTRIITCPECYGKGTK